MGLFSTTLLSGISTIIRVLSGFVANKVMAVVIGPSGVGLLGQFQNVVSIVTTFGTGGTNQGVTKYIAERQAQGREYAPFLASGLQLSVAVSAGMSVLLIIFNRLASLLVFHNSHYGSVFIVLGASLIFISINAIFMASINGLKLVKLYITLGAAGNILGLFITVLLCLIWGTSGAMLSTVLSQTIVLGITLLFFSKIEHGWWRYIFQRLDKEKVRLLLSYSAMAIVSATVFPVSQLIIRTMIITHISTEAAGYWQGVWRISDVYLSVVTTSITTYYLPRLAEIQDARELRGEIVRVYKFLLPIVLLSEMAIFFSRDLIISVLYTSQFAPMKQLFAFQLLGDLLKIASWILSFLMLAKSMTLEYVISEILFSLVFVILSYYFILGYGLVGVTYSFAFSYFLYLVGMVFIFRKILFSKTPKWARD